MQLLVTKYLEKTVQLPYSGIKMEPVSNLIGLRDSLRPAHNFFMFGAQSQWFSSRREAVKSGELGWRTSLSRHTTRNLWQKTRGILKPPEASEDLKLAGFMVNRAFTPGLLVYGVPVGSDNILWRVEEELVRHPIPITTENLGLDMDIRVPVDLLDGRTF